MKQYVIFTQINNGDCFDESAGDILENACKAFISEIHHLTKRELDCRTVQLLLAESDDEGILDLDHAEIIAENRTSEPRYIVLDSDAAFLESFYGAEDPTIHQIVGIAETAIKDLYDDWCIEQPFEEYIEEHFLEA